MEKKQIRKLLIIFSLILIVVLFFIIVNIFYRYNLKNFKSDKIINVYGDLIQGDKDLQYQSLDQFPKDFLEKLIKIEDKRFYDHIGIDVIGLMRAFNINIRKFSIKQWASTLDQQVIKISQSAYNRSLIQKIKENLLAVNINFHYPKEEILLYYINNLEFFNWIRWFNSACYLYFQKDCKDLFLSEQLFLISIYQLWKNPLDQTNFTIIKKRSKVLCQSLESQLDEIEINQCNDFYNLFPQKISDIKLNIDNSLLHYKIWLENNSSEKVVINVNINKKIDQILDNSQVFIDNFGMYDCCIIILDKQWNVENMNLCRDWDDKYYGKINWCLTKRQTGSAIKPFLYILAMNKLNMNKDSVLQDTPVEYWLDLGNLYIPRNFDLEYHWDVTLAKALWSSLNIPAVKLLDKIWVALFIDYLEEIRLLFGKASLEQIVEDQTLFNSEELGLSAALWTYEISPLEFARFWTMFFDQDLEFSRIYWKSINQVFEILKDNNNRLLSFDQDNYLDISWWAVKTWTSRHFVDGWACWVNRDLEKIVCVWAGNYNWARMTWSWIQTAWYLWHLLVNEIFE